MLYTNIARDFHKTRGYVWPCVRKFIQSIPDKSQLSIFEAGCGNGRNLIYALDAGFHSVSGMDICPQFVEICRERMLNVSEGDILEPLNKKYDIILSVAVIHHLDSEQKRIIAIKNLINSLNPAGRLFITLWSHEKYDSIAQKEFSLGDNIVPWHSRDGTTVLEYRFYYIYNKELLIETLNKLDTDYKLEWEEQNWIITIEKRVV